MHLLLQGIPQVVGRVAQRAAGVGGDARGVEVDVVCVCEVGGEAAGEAVGEGLGEGVEGEGDG